MFDGKVGGTRTISSGNRKDTKATTKDLVEKAKKEREQRAIQRQRNDAAKKLQAFVRKYLSQKKTFAFFREQFDKKMQEIQGYKALLKSKGANFITPSKVLLHLLCQLTFFFRDYSDQLRVRQLQNLVIGSLESTETMYNIVHDDNPSNQSRSLSLIVGFVKSSLQLVLRCWSEHDATALLQHLEFVQRIWNLSFQDASVSLLHEKLFPFICQALNSLHLAVRRSSCDTLADQAFAMLGSFLVKSFSTSERSLRGKIEAISDFLLTLPDLGGNPSLSAIIASFANSEIVQNGGGPILCLFLHPGTDKKSRAHRFYCIANFSHLILGAVSSQFNSIIMEGIRVPWIAAVHSLFAEEATEEILSTVTSKTSPFLGKPSMAKGKSLSTSIHQGIPLVLYLCRQSSGFPLLLLEEEEDKFMNVDIRSDEEDPSAIRKTAWQQQEQEIFNEYIVGDGIRKIEIRISMILNEIARRENKEFVSQQSHLVMEPIESILRVLTNRDVAASLFDIVRDSSQPLQTRLSVINVYAKVLISYPYKILDNVSKTGENNKRTGVTEFTTRESLLATLAFGRPQAPIALLLWNFLLQHFAETLPMLTLNEKRVALADLQFQQMASTCNMKVETLYSTFTSLIYLFCIIFTNQLAATDDQELFSGEWISTDTLIEMTRFLRQWFYKIFWLEPTCDFLSSFLHPKESMISYHMVLQYSCLMASTKLFQQLCIRHERRPFLAENDYQWTSLPTHEFELVDAETSERYYQVDRDDNVLLSASVNKEGDFFVKNPNLQMVLTYIPQVIPFSQRVSLFQALVDRDKQEYFSALSGRMNIEEMITGGQIVRITVRRGNMMEDAMKGLHSLHHRLKGRVQVEFISEQGFQEAGIDGGGLFKEFMDDFAQLIGDPELGLFVATSEHLLTPNPASEYMIGRSAIVERRNIPALKQISDSSNSAMDVDTLEPKGESTQSAAQVSTSVSTNRSANNNSRMRAGILSNRSHLEIFEFTGKMLGKALYEKILFQSELAPGFLNMLLGRTNSLDDLYHLDAALYRSLTNLKRFVFQEKGNMEDLDLYFDTEWVVHRQRISEEIIPNGSKLKVNNANLLIYIHRLSNFKQNVKIRDQCRAFLKGFRVMIPIDWIRMFNTQELQLLISGDRRRIDLADMQRHVVYGSGYHPSQPYIQAFWSIVGEMSAEDQALLLKFVTSSPRQPLLGFQALNPKFSIQQVSAYTNVPLGSSRIPTDEEPRLPTAATCMNLLKLPLYPSVEILREKLLYAIRPDRKSVV